MTKAKEALDEFNVTVDFINGIGSISSFHKNDFFPNPTHIETIRKALKLLDKVEQGGIDTYDMYLDNCNYEEDNYDAGWNHAIAEINEKYILIEKKEND